MLEKLKDKFGKVDKKALAGAIGIMLLSWAALPLVYFLLVRRKKRNEKTKPISEEQSTTDTNKDPSPPLDT